MRSFIYQHHLSQTDDRCQLHTAFQLYFLGRFSQLYRRIFIKPPYLRALSKALNRIYKTTYGQKSLIEHQLKPQFRNKNFLHISLLLSSSSS